MFGRAPANSQECRVIQKIVDVRNKNIHTSLNNNTQRSSGSLSRHINTAANDANRTKRVNINETYASKVRTPVTSTRDDEDDAAFSLKEILSIFRDLNLKLVFNIIKTVVAKLKSLRNKDAITKLQVIVETVVNLL